MKYFEHLILLKNIKGMGPATIYKRYCSLVEEHPDFDDFKDCIIDEGLASQFEVVSAESKINKVRNALEQNNQVSIITCFDDDYPDRFNMLGNQRPLYIYVAGNRSVLKDETVAVIGTRKPSEYGVSAGRKIIAEIKKSVIVSGLALGTDRVAHEAAIHSSLKTIAVLPSGLNNIAPSSNRQLAGIIADGNGCLISEYDLDDRPEKYTYLRRDSLVAALSDVIVVIECGEKSGTMHTVEAAMKMHKPIACYYTDRGGDYSGNKKLIDSGSAVRLFEPGDINDVINSVGKQISMKDMMAE